MKKKFFWKFFFLLFENFLIFPGGDPFSDAVWLPVLDLCTIECDLTSQYCVENEELVQQCKTREFQDFWLISSDFRWKICFLNGKRHFPPLLFLKSSIFLISSTRRLPEASSKVHQTNPTFSTLPTPKLINSVFFYRFLYILVSFWWFFQ